jgi:hypothetical protein
LSFRGLKRLEKGTDQRSHQFQVGEVILLSGLFLRKSTIEGRVLFLRFRQGYSKGGRNVASAILSLNTKTSSGIGNGKRRAGGKEAAVVSSGAARSRNASESEFVTAP